MGYSYSPLFISKTAFQGFLSKPDLSENDDNIYIKDKINNYAGNRP